VNDKISDERLKMPISNLENTLRIRLNEHLLGMKPDYDDSIVGFNEAQDIVNEVFKKYRIDVDELIALRTASEGMEKALEQLLTDGGRSSYPLRRNAWTAGRAALSEYRKAVGKLIDQPSTESK
jgi:hypothetical protein